MDDETTTNDIIMTDGIISRLIKDKVGQLISIQINASVSKGFSGGPVFDETTGEVIGIITSIFYIFILGPGIGSFIGHPSLQF